jgi:Mg2+ and Co2+ transporter CorA
VRIRKSLIGYDPASVSRELRLLDFQAEFLEQLIQKEHQKGSRQIRELEARLMELKAAIKGRA